MSFIDPKTVTSPKGHWLLLKVVVNTGDGGWSLARGEWDKRPVWASRWNGSDKYEGIGNPQSRGIPTWFVLPDEAGDLLDVLATNVGSLAVARDQAKGKVCQDALKNLLEAYDGLIPPETRMFAA